MQITYQKLGSDHPMFGKVEYLVADGTQPLCYKTKDGYIPLEEGAAPAAAAPQAQAEVATRDLYVLSFKVNGEAEEQTFTSKKKLDKTVALYQEKAFISDIESKTYKVLAN
ncbi:hypothetical protein [Thiomicrorhabdus sp. 6S3-12]|uniref:hypothetical protein n=1 Tax=Thiomicrorhabdus sp. 6S3-12 TaxID=2819681 RepID=UPI001AADF13B|nr:hypothetical protein [Thiomicrorhabdus sp. 6S3-12]MBO1924908.1 hypothetical protein [Thiomicrorhabdus sp. 6S3-12]